MPCSSFRRSISSSRSRRRCRSRSSASASSACGSEASSKAPRRGTSRARARSRCCSSTSTCRSATLGRRGRHRAPADRGSADPRARAGQGGNWTALFANRGHLLGRPAQIEPADRARAASVRHAARQPARRPARPRPRQDRQPAVSDIEPRQAARSTTPGLERQADAAEPFATAQFQDIDAAPSCRPRPTSRRTPGSSSGSPAPTHHAHAVKRIVLPRADHHRQQLQGARAEFRQLRPAGFHKVPGRQRRRPLDADRGNSRSARGPSTPGHRGAASYVVASSRDNTTSTRPPASPARKGRGLPPRRRRPGSRPRGRHPRDPGGGVQAA